MSAVESIYQKVIARDPNQPEFHQAVLEVLESLEPVLEAHPEYTSIAERVVEPERLIQFRVPWVDDSGIIQVNRVLESNSMAQLDRIKVVYVFIPVLMHQF